MDRLATQLDRLYGPVTTEPQQAVRALVLEVTGTDAWQHLSRAWQGVQEALELPAPAIAVSGTNAFQLWFALASPAEPTASQAFLDGVRTRYLSDLPTPRIRTYIGVARPRVPAEQADGNWSAFIARDLAPVFAETPWLDIPPGADGQADLLATLRAISADQWAAALSALSTPSAAAPSALAHAPSSTSHAATSFTDPRSFLLHVMNDLAVPLALRIDAAKALLAASRSADAD